MRTLTTGVAALLAVLLSGVVAPTTAKATPDAGYVIASSDTEGLPDRWYPCAPLTWKVSLNGAPRSEVRAVREAIGSISRATHLSFDYRGESSFVATSDLQSATQAAGVDILVGFARPGGGPFRTRLLTPTVAGYGGRSVGGEFTGWANSGGAVFNLPTVLKMTPGERATLYRHELGHVMGLGHSSGSSVMAPGRLDVRTWSEGDLAGLRAVGRQPGDCKDANAAAPITGAPLPVTGLASTALPDGSVRLDWQASPVGPRAMDFDVLLITERPDGESSGVGHSVPREHLVIAATELALVEPGQVLVAEVEASNRFGNAEPARVIVVDRR